MMVEILYGCSGFDFSDTVLDHFVKDNLDGVSYGFH